MARVRYMISCIPQDFLGIKDLEKILKAKTKVQNSKFQKSYNFFP